MRAARLSAVLGLLLLAGPVPPSSTSAAPPGTHGVQVGLSPQQLRVAVRLADASPTAPPPRLSSPVEARRFGLPLVLATVLVGGMLSLLARLLLAEPPTGALPLPQPTGSPPDRW